MFPCFLVFIIGLSLASSAGVKPGLKPFFPQPEDSKAPHVLPNLSSMDTPVDKKSNATNCPTCLLVKSSSTVQPNFPWLFNNQQARFNYMRTDADGYAVYQYIGGQGNVYYLHFYDEGFFYNGFWVINDLEDGYQEVEGRVFIYNSDYELCPDQTGRNWYYFTNNDWVWDSSIYELCPDQTGRNWYYFTNN